ERGEMVLAALEQCGTQARVTGLPRDADLEESWTLGALVFDRGSRPADEPALLFRGPVAAVRVRRRRVGRVPEAPFGADAVRPGAVQQFGRRPEILAPSLAHHDPQHRRLPATYSVAFSASQAFATRFCARVSHASITRSCSSDLLSC